ncbi:MAG: hypothetical protein GXO10_00840 [Crenarchaeota archaeon]|nr:hypothetical protein [Thermoproteota archaeon]
MAVKLVSKAKVKEALHVNAVHKLIGDILSQEVGGLVCESNQEFISTGLDTLDFILGGGFPVGQYTLIVGHPGSAKSTLVCRACHELEKKYKEKAFTIYIDTEQSMSVTRLKQLGVTQASIVNGVSIEQVFAYLTKIDAFKNDAGLSDIPSIFVWDTCANTMSAKELDKITDPNSSLGWRARLLSFWIPKMLPLIYRSKIAVVIVNQLRDKIDSGFAASPTDLKYLSHSKNIPGGNALKFNAFTLIELKDRGKVPDTYGFPGAIIEIKTVKCKSFPANVRLNVVLDYRTGFNRFWSNVHFLKEKNQLVGSGASTYLKEYPDMRTKTRLLEHTYNKDPKFKAAFDEVLQKTLQETFDELSAYVITPPTLAKSDQKEATDDESNPEPVQEQPQEPINEEAQVQDQNDDSCPFDIDPTQPTSLNQTHTS